jgi:hypothetical protein
MVRAFSSCPTREDGRSGRRSSPHMAHPLAPSGTGSAQRGQRSRSSKTVVLRRNSRTASPFGSEPPIIAQGSRLIHAYKTPFDATRRYGQFCATWAAQPTRRAAKQQQHRRGQLAEQDRPGRAASPCWNSFRRGRSARNAACYRARSRADVARGAPWWRPERICRLSAPPHQRPWGVGEIKGEDDSG